MCFAPQWRPKFRHRNFQRSWCILFIWLGNVLRATAVCHFWHLNYQSGPTKVAVSDPKAGHTSCVFDHFGLEMCFAPQRRALFHFSSRHMAPRPRFSEPTSRPSRPTNRKNAMFCDLPHISSACIFFLLTLSLSVFYSILLLFYSSLLSSTLIFSACHLSILSEVWLVNFRWLAFLFMRLLLFACARHFHILQQLDLFRDSLSVWKSQQLVRSVLSNDVNKSKAFSVPSLVLTEGFERCNWSILPIRNWVLHWHVFFCGFRWVKRQRGRP